MPQLNPAPWFFILFFSWVIMLTIFKTKVTNSTTMNTPTPQDPSTHHTTPWNWPWT